ncbi:MAG: DUF4292 domain-containing protein [Prevotella sp.]|nr:DUF4292 domain-containing protein [Prevotella sp.]
MNHSKKIVLVAWIALPLFFGACGTKKVVTDNTGTTSQQATSTTTPTTPVAPTTSTVPAVDKTTQLAFVKKVIDNASGAQNIVSSIDFNIKSGKKDITVDGKICMRRDEVVRIQLSPMGLVEVGRLEFTRDSVLIMDRIHKQFLKSSYDQIGFLKDNGIDFYALQSLFWNQLFEPGSKTVKASQAEAFEVNGHDISLAKGKMKYIWTTNDNGLIDQTQASYASSSKGTSSLQWKYSDFVSFASKMFPTKQAFTIQTSATGSQKKIDVIIDMKKLKTDSDWEATTKVPAKYKPVNLKDVINQILKM